jgi:hypothetical protein
MKSRLFLAFLITLVTLIRAPAFAGSIFVTGHDPIWHANFGGNAAGAENLALAGISFARDGNIAPFLFIESNDPVPSGNAYEEPFLVSALGFAPADFVAMDATALLALPDFRVALNSYSAIVVASDHGGMLSADELLFLNGHSSDIIDYLNAGGGLFASAESDARGLIGATPRFGFLPFLVTSTDFQTPETENVVTPFGAGLGLVDADVNGNFSHNYFASTGGMNPVDLFNGLADVPLTLAYRGPITPTGVPEPGTILLLGAALGALSAARKRRG